MIDWIAVGVGLVGGAVVGALFFGGLWWTLSQLQTARRPAVIFGISFLVRTFIALAGFVIVAGGSVERLLAAMVGFLVARVMLVNTLGFENTPARTATPEDEQQIHAGTD